MSCNWTINDLNVNISTSDFDKTALFISPTDTGIRRLIIVSVFNSSLGFLNLSNTFLNMTQVYLNSLSITNHPAVIMTTQSMVLINECHLVDNHGMFDSWNLSQEFQISTIRNLNNFTKVFHFNSSYITVINSTFKYNSGLLSIFSINNSHITFINCKFSQNEGSVLIGVLSPSITIKSCTFKSNKAAVGAVLLLYGVLRSNLTNSTFIQNIAKIGGIIFASNSTGLYISECRFMSNYAGRGSVMFGQFLKSIEISHSQFVSNNGYTGAIEISHSLIGIKYCMFTDAKVVNGGAALVLTNKSKCNLINSNFTKHYDEHLTSYVSVIYIQQQSEAFVSNCSFVNNSIVSIMALMLVNVTLVDARFNANSHSTLIGLAVNIKDNSNLHATSCTFISNEGYQGSAIYASNKTNVYVKNSMFKNNYANLAGAIYVDTIVFALFSGCIFSSNAASRGAAMMIDTKCDVRIMNCSFIFNEAISIQPMKTYLNPKPGRNSLKTGGAILVTASKIHIADSTFMNNKSPLMTAVFSFENSSSVSIHLCSFQNNTSEFDAVSLFAQMSSFISITDTTFADNNGVSDNGIINVKGNVSLHVANCTFHRNQQSIFYIYDHSQLLLESSRFDGHRYRIVMGRSSFLNVSNCIFILSTESAPVGTPFDLKDSILIASRVHLINSGLNILSSFVQALHQCRLHFKYCNFLNSSNVPLDAAYGRNVILLAIYGGTHLTMEHCQFAGNNDIGMIYAYGNSSINLNNLTFSNNKACFFLNVEVNFLSTVNNVALLGNTIKIMENLITVSGGQFNFTNSVAYNNIGKMNEGVIGIYNSNSSISHCRFTNNSSFYHGGVLEVQSNVGSYLQIVNSTFKFNKAMGDGAAISVYSDPSIDIAIDSCVFYMNSAPSDTAIYIELPDISSAHFSNVTIIGEQNKTSMNILCVKVKGCSKTGHIYHDDSLSVDDISANSTYSPYASGKIH